MNPRKPLIILIITIIYYLLIIYYYYSIIFCNFVDEYFKTVKDMGRTKNDGRGRLGGRAKGTPNKITPVQDWLDETLRKHRPRIERELLSVNPDNFALAYAALSLAASIRHNTAALSLVAEAKEHADALRSTKGGK